MDGYDEYEELAKLDKPALMRSAALRGEVIEQKGTIIIQLEKRVLELEQHNRELVEGLKECCKNCIAVNYKDCEKCKIQIALKKVKSWEKIA